MNADEATTFHISAKTPLFRLANSVKWFEAHGMRAKAKAMRKVLTNVFVARATSGEYEE